MPSSSERCKGRPVMLDVRRYLGNQDRAAWTAAILLGSTYGVMLSLDGAPWRGDELWGQELVTSIQMVSLTLTGGVGAWVGMRDGRGVGRLLGRAADVRRLAISRIASLLAPMALTLGLTNSAIVILSRRSTIRFDNWSLIEFISQLAMISLTTTMGYCVGLRLPSLVTVLLAAVSWAAVLTASNAGWVSALFESGENGILATYEPNLGRFLLRGITALIAVAGIIAYVASPGRFGQWRLVGLVPIILACTVFPRGEDLLASSGGTSPPLCRTVGKGPQICAPAPFATRLTETATLASRAADGLRTMGIPAPPRLEAWTPEADLRHAAWVPIVNSRDIQAPVPPTAVIGAVVGPTSCPVWWGDNPPSTVWGYAHAVGTDWIASRLGIRGAGSEYERVVSVLGADRAQREVADALTRLAACRDEGFGSGLIALAG